MKIKNIVHASNKMGHWLKERRTPRKFYPDTLHKVGQWGNTDIFAVMLDEEKRKLDVLRH